MAASIASRRPARQSWTEYLLTSHMHSKKHTADKQTDRETDRRPDRQMRRRRGQGRIAHSDAEGLEPMRVEPDGFPVSPLNCPGAVFRWPCDGGPHIPCAA